MQQITSGKTGAFLKIIAIGLIATGCVTVAFWFASVESVSRQSSAQLSVAPTAVFPSHSPQPGEIEANEDPAQWGTHVGYDFRDSSKICVVSKTESCGIYQETDGISFGPDPHITQTH